MDAERDDLKRLGKLIKDIRTAMMTTWSEGQLHSRPMATIEQHEFDGDVWLFTSTGSQKVDELKRDAHVCLTYSDGWSHRYACLSGMAELVDDPPKVRAFWSPFYQAWFPDGPNDPNLGLLKFSAQRAEFWDSPSSPVVRIVGLARPLITGARFQPGHHASMNLH